VLCCALLCSVVLWCALLFEEVCLCILRHPGDVRVST
jgi:hypothetical protein